MDKWSKSSGEIIGTIVVEVKELTGMVVSMKGSGRGNKQGCGQIIWRDGDVLSMTESGYI